MQSRRNHTALDSTATTTTIRLLICDDAPEAREAIRVMLGDHSEIAVVGEAANGEEAVALAHALSPDVVLMDVEMPVLDGVAATRSIRELLPGVRVVAFSASDEPEVVAAMIEAGASAYCVKGSPPEELERAIAGAGTPLHRPVAEARLRPLRYQLAPS